ncbi:protamine-like [Drosophila obscura]|uniref:protamine-like n=1 Tax=Drosophila obscura TaxID=7282 RepID=UPI001BB2525D|nr:protamine-like [Drosophila obscura]
MCTSKLKNNGNCVEVDQERSVSKPNLDEAKASGSGAVADAGCPQKKTSIKRSKRRLKPVPHINNGYLNFIKKFRLTHGDLQPLELIRQAAKAWCRLRESQKNIYRRMACPKSRNSRHKKCGTSKRKTKKRSCKPEKEEEKKHEE